MNVQKLTKDLERKAEEELNENPARMQESVQHIREWLREQPHLSFPDDDQTIVLFLRVCKYRLQDTKDRIDNYCTMLALTPEIFLDRDPLSREMQTILSANAITALPSTDGATGPRILMFRFDKCHPEEIFFVDIIKAYFMLVYTLSKEDDNCAVAGLSMIIDFGGFPLNYLLQFNIGLLKKVQKCNYVRIKNVCLINVPTVVEPFCNSIKHLFTEKLQKRMILDSSRNYCELYKLYPQSILPNEYGGNAGSFDELSAAWKHKLESCQGQLINTRRQYSHDVLRVGQPKTYLG